MFSGLQDDGWPSALITLIASPVTQSHLALITCCLIPSSLSSPLCVSYLPCPDDEGPVPLIWVFYSLCPARSQAHKGEAHCVEAAL